MKSLRTFIQIHRSIKQHATVFSGVVVVLLFGLFMEAYMHDFNLVYITLFFVFSLAFSAGPIGVLNIGRIEAVFLPAGRLFAGVEGSIPLRLKNPTQTSSWALKVHHDDTFVFVPQIKSNSATTIKLPFTPAKRGTFTFKGCSLESKYPLSTARLSKPIQNIYEGLAYPQPKGISLETFLNEQETYYGEEKEFDGLHKYDGSQKPTHIHWASVAKGEMAVKVFTKETQTPNLVFRFSDAGSDDESRLSQLCLWVLECEKKHLSFGLELPKQHFNSTKESIDEILEALGRY